MNSLTLSLVLLCIASVVHAGNNIEKYNDKIELSKKILFSTENRAKKINAEIVPGYKKNVTQPSCNLERIDKNTLDHAKSKKTNSGLKLNVDKMLRLSENQPKGIFCLQGKCKTMFKPTVDEHELQRTISMLHGAHAAAKGAKNNSLFQGNPYWCRIKPTGYSNCCRLKGWGNDFHLSNCHSYELELSKHRKKGNCIRIGEQYCDKHFKWIKGCKQHKEAYCCFQSKLARIIQSQGRAQLNLDFGSKNTIHCEGLTTKQMQLINFNRIDFSEYYITIDHSINLPNHKKDEEKIARNVQEQFK